MFDEQLVTVWSAPNYCYRCGNMASILTFSENGGKEFCVYDAAEENKRDKGMQTRKMVGVNFSGCCVAERLCRTQCHILYDRIFGSYIVGIFLYIDGARLLQAKSHLLVPLKHIFTSPGRERMKV